MQILITGCAGFIGWKVSEFLLTHGFDSMTQRPNELNGPNVANALTVIGIDNLDDSYDVRLKQWRLNQLNRLCVHPRLSAFSFHKVDITDYSALKSLFTSPSLRFTPQIIINLAARAGVRYSLENPFVYYATNVFGNLNLLELCREFGIKKYILASTSSLYAGQKLPFKEDLPVNEPISPYAASKKGAEVTCYAYHKLYDIDITILRYFTVYGPAGRPDMSVFRFISWINQGKPVTIYGDGTQTRDFTYVDDIAAGTVKALKPLGFEIINLGNDNPHKLIDALHMIERRLNKKAEIKYLPFHKADLMATHADISKAKKLLNWEPTTNIDRGIDLTVNWYLENRKWASEIKL